MENLNDVQVSQKSLLGCTTGKVHSVRLTSPIGMLVLDYCSRGIHSLNLDSQVRDETFMPQTSQRVTVIATQEPDNFTTAHVESRMILTATVKWLDSYFHDVKKMSTIVKPPLCWRSEERNFFHKCLDRLPVIADFGQTVSYSCLAAAAGNSKASRVAGGAMRNNPVLIMVPCHRVITKSGAMGKFSGGTRQKIKRWLLNHEGRKF